MAKLGETVEVGQLKASEEEISELREGLGKLYLASLFHLIELARERFLKLDQFIPMDTWIEPVSFRFAEPGMTEKACDFLVAIGYLAVLDDDTCRILKLSKDHFPEDTKVKIDLQDVVQIVNEEGQEEEEELSIL